MSHLFCFLAEQAQPDHWLIKEQELVHLTKVLRLKVGDKVQVFDGNGASGEGVITDLSKTQAQVTARTIASTAKTGSLTLAISALKPGSLDEIIPPLVELGVTNLCVFLSKGHEKSRLAAEKLGRWQKIALASTKQSKRNYLPKIEIFSDLKTLLAAKNIKEGLKIYLDPQGERHAYQKIATANEMFVVLGSEQGLSLEEISWLNELNFSPVTLGPYILRAKTAAISLCSLFHASWPRSDINPI